MKQLARVVLICSTHTTQHTHICSAKMSDAVVYQHCTQLHELATDGMLQSGQCGFCPADLSMFIWTLCIVQVIHIFYTVVYDTILNTRHVRDRMCSCALRASHNSNFVRCRWPYDAIQLQLLPIVCHSLHRAGSNIVSCVQNEY